MTKERISEIRNICKLHSVPSELPEALDALEAAQAELERLKSPGRKLCRTHPDVDYRTAWGCPECVAEMRKELEQERKWKEEDPRMLREQIRVADVAFNHLHSEHKAMTAELNRVTSCLSHANAEFEKYERLWYLRGDELERLKEHVRWRPVTEMPAYRGDYLVAWLIDGVNRYEVETWSGARWLNFHSDNRRLILWAPLPEPPKGDHP